MSREIKGDRLRVAVIGAGWWGTTAHVPALRDHPRAELLAVQHNEREEAERIARDFGVPHPCTTLEEVLAIDDLDAVVISSVPVAHYPQAKAALQQGLHVLIEKPMTITAAQAHELLGLARRKRVLFLISGPWHYTPHSIEAQRLIRSGALGAVKQISILMTNFTLGLYQGLPWERVFGRNPTLQNAAEPYMKPTRTGYSDPKVAGGGQIYCQVSHAAAYVAYLTGRRPAEVFARFDNAGTKVDVYDAINMALDDGTLVSIASNGATMLSERNYEVRVYGDRGMIFLELWKGTMEFHDVDCNVKRYEPIAAGEVYPLFEPTRNLVDSVLGLAPNRSPAALGAFAMEVAEASVKSARTKRNVVVKSKLKPGYAGEAPSRSRSRTRAVAV